MITACLKAFGISPLYIDRFTILAINGISLNVHSFNRNVGTGSDIQYLNSDFKAIYSSSTDTGVYCESLSGEKPRRSYLSKSSEILQLSPMLSNFQ